MHYIPDKDSPEWGLCYAINHLVTKMRLSTLQSLRAQGYTDLSLDHYILLFTLAKNNGVYQRQLSKALLKDRPSVTRMITALEKKKLVIRKAHQTNKKIQEIYITELGKQLVHYAAMIKNSQAEKFLKDFSEDELLQLQNLTSKMMQNLEGMYIINT